MFHLGYSLAPKASFFLPPDAGIGYRKNGFQNSYV